MNIRSVQLIHLGYILFILINVGLAYQFEKMGVAKVELGIPLATLRMALALLFCAEIVGAPLLAGHVLRAASPHDEGQFLSQWSRSQIILACFYTSGALYGMLLKMSGGSSDDLLYFSGAALVFMCLSFPTAQKYEAARQKSGPR